MKLKQKVLRVMLVLEAVSRRTRGDDENYTFVLSKINLRLENWKFHEQRVPKIRVFFI